MFEVSQLTNHKNSLTMLEEDGLEDKPLFDPQMVYNLDFSKFKGTFNPEISPVNPGENLKLRSLQKSDYDKGYMQLLTHLTVVGDVSREQFEARFNAMQACPNSYFVVVIEDTSVGEVVGSATLAVEQKFIRGTKCKGRVEDVVVSDKYRGKQLGKLLVGVLVLLSQQVDCYKISLECLDKMVNFYSAFGFIKEPGQNYMCRRF